MFVVRRGVQILGTVQSSEPIEVEGVVDGHLSADVITVASDARVSGLVIGNQVTVRGTVVGDIYADRLVLGSSCHVEGDIYHGELVLEPGSTFEGKSRRYSEPRKLAPVGELDSALQTPTLPA